MSQSVNASEEISRRPTVEPVDRVEQLITASLAWDGQSWELLVDTYAGLIHRTAGQLGLPDSDRAQVFEAVCFQLWRSLPQIKDPSELPDWLVKATTGAVWKRLRARSDEASPAGSEAALVMQPHRGRRPGGLLVFDDRGRLRRRAQ